MDKIKFERIEHEYHVNTELMHFMMELKAKAVEANYPYIQTLLFHTLKQFDEMDKNSAYLIEGFNPLNPF